MKHFLFTLALSLYTLMAAAQVWQYVDPRIGSVGVGRTFPGPCMPFGMVKPGPDCGVLPNAGWAPMPEAVSGFSQTHVSGTGGGQKYGNILIQPFIGNGSTRTNTDVMQRRVEETISLGYYSTTYENGIRTEITTSERCAFYRFHFPRNARLLVDVTHFLGKDTVPNLRERQQFVGADMEVAGPCEVSGFSRIRGGWNNGDAYTVYFCLTTDQPFTLAGGNVLAFTDTVVQVKVGISYVSTMQARRNIDSHGFNEQLAILRNAWEQQLSKVQVEGTDRQKRIFYTALYHTMLMPVCKTGENPKWTDSPYYDDYYAIWDTYRTSSPLLTLLWPERQVEIVNSLLNIYVREGYMPDARSGDCNGRTQGGSNADVVIADAFVKGLGRSGSSVCCDSVAAPSINYSLALEAMLKDGEADPGADHEKHGRGGLNEYKRLGYVPYGIPRAGTRTVEYAYNDYCIAQVARGLGHQDIYEEYIERSRNWHNLWRSDYEWDDVRGYIMPRDDQGQWLDSVPWGRSRVFHPAIPYTPVTKVAPWYLPWWDTFFYEALSAEYSLSIPHDVPGLIEACGGPDAFRRRLDMFFERDRYNVGNEPSFLTPCLYHWIGRPDLSTRRIHQIVRDNYSDQPDGLPGNDDGGAMSSWLAFHALGLYPNAGQDYYLLNTPLLPEYTFSLSNGRTLHATRQTGNRFAVFFNGRELPDARITHQELMQGGELVFIGITEQVPPVPPSGGASPTVEVTDTASRLGGGWRGPADLLGGGLECAISFTLNRQFRTWPLSFRWNGDTLVVTCKEATYHIGRSVVENAASFCWDIPADGAVYDTSGTFAFVSHQAVRQLLDNGAFTYDGITWRRTGTGNNGQIHLKADVDHTEMTIEHNAALDLYLVTEMSHNPLGIDWRISKQQ